MGCQWLCGGEGGACAHLCAVHSQLSFPRATCSRMVPSGSFRVSQGLASPCTVALSPELQQWQSCDGPFTGLGTSPGSFLHPHGVPKPFTKVR